MGQKILLIVDDDPADYRLIKKAFMRRGTDADLQSASSAKAGLDVIQKGNVKAIFVNESLPEMDGFKFLRKLKDLEIHLPVIMTLSTHDEKVVRKALSEGATDCVMRRAESFNAFPFVLDRAVAKFELDRERKEKEKLIRESQQLWVSIIDGIKDYIFIVDDELKIFRANRSLSEAFGKHPRDVIGKELHELFGDGLSYMLHEYIEKGLPQIEERTINDETYLVSSFPLVHNKKPLTICVMKNMSEMQRLKEQLYHSYKLASLGLLISGVAHEISNPIAAIITSVEFLRMKVGDKEIEKGLMRIFDSAERCKKVIENLLTFSRQKIPSKSLESMNSIIDRAIELRNYWLRQYNIKVVTAYDEVPMVVVDSQQLQQVILNILLNAEQAIVSSDTQNGRIRIATKYDRNSRRIVVKISDNGPGIPKDLRSKIFDPFFSTKPVGTGTGLGLSISHGIIAEHGGSIRAESSAGKGATFIIEIPRRNQEKDSSCPRR